MTQGQSDSLQLSSLLDTQSAATGPLDAAVEYLRLRIGNIFPIYVLSMIPHAVATALLIDALIAEQRSRIGRYCLYLTAATIWRWIGLTWIQRQTQRDLQLRPGRSFFRQLTPILLLRLYSSAAINWGIFGLGVPSFYGLFVSAFAAPLMLDDSTPSHGRIKNCLLQIRRSSRRLLRVTLALTVMTIWLVVVLLVLQYFVLEFVLPHFFDIQLTEITVTMNSWAWRLGIFYFAFLILNMFWTVAGVILYYDSQSRQMGTDLYARLALLKAGEN